MNKNLLSVNIGPVSVNVYGLDRYNWRPARWWSPQVTHLRPLPGVTINIPRRWWPGRKDGYRRCGFCGQVRWMEGPPNGACPECKRTLDCMETYMKGPPWWPDMVREAYQRATGRMWER